PRARGRKTARATGAREAIASSHTSHDALSRVVVRGTWAPACWWLSGNRDAMTGAKGRAGRPSRFIARGWIAAEHEDRQDARSTNLDLRPIPRSADLYRRVKVAMGSNRIRRSACLIDDADARARFWVAACGCARPLRGRRQIGRAHV